MSKQIDPIKIDEEMVDIDRRRALSRLGLAASTVYAAPLLMTLSQSAHASDGGSGSGGGSDGSDGSSDGPTEGGTDGISDGSDEEFLETGSA